MSNKGQVHIALILLAAGTSSRLGQPKQMIKHNGMTLLHHSLQQAKSSEAAPIAVVLGAYADLLEKEIQDTAVSVLINEEWKEGMASSIRTGIQAINSIAPSAAGVIIMVCDQPYISAQMLNHLIQHHKATSKPIVASAYQNTFGPPVLFTKDYFPELLQLKGETGARRVILDHMNDAALIEFSLGHIDLDTQEDIEFLNKNKLR